MKSFAITTFIVAMALVTPAAAAPTERRLHSDNIDASTFLWNDWNKFVENYHPNYVADDDPKTAWVEGAKTSGAGEWIRIQVTPLDKTTRVRLMVRNGYQKSKDLFKANARAKEVTLRLLPSKAEKKLTLADKDGWQELVIEQASGPVRSVELAVGGVYEGSKYADLCISDVQVFATSDTADNPAFEKSKRDTLMAWRSARLAAAQMFKSNKVEVPLYPAYTVTASDAKDTETGIDLAGVLAAAAADPAFAKEWKDALALANQAVGAFASMPRVQLAPTSNAKLVEVDGIQITELHDIESGEGPYLDEDALRLPMLGTVSALFADQLRVLDVKDKQTIKDFMAASKLCKDTTWAMRSSTAAAGKEPAPAILRALVLGRCGRVEHREGSSIVNTIEVLVYDASGKLVLLAGFGHIEGYRWTADGTRPMLAGGRSILALNGKIIEAKKREAVAAK